MALSVHLRSYVCDFIFLGGLYMSEGLDLCSSAKMQPIRDLIAKVAATNTTLLLRGESGGGQEEVGPADPHAVARPPSPPAPQPRRSPPSRTRDGPRAAPSGCPATPP